MMPMRLKRDAEVLFILKLRIWRSIKNFTMGLPSIERTAAIMK
jgi:hypothetical protein